MASLGTLALDVVAKTMPFERGLSRAQKKTQGFAKSIKGDLGSAIGDLQGKLALVTGGLGLGGLAAFSVKAAADLESTKTAFEVMLGSAEKADKAVKGLFDFSKATPFEPKEVFGVGRQMLAAGFSVDETTDRVQMLGDIAAGSQSSILELAAAFAQVKATGRTELGDINKFANRGIPIYDALAKAMGRTKGEIRKLAQDGKIDVEVLETAFREMTGEGGIYFGAMAKQSKTLNGLFSTLKGNIGSAAAELGAAVTGATDFKGAVSQVNEVLSSTDWKAVGEDIADAWKTAVDWADKLDGAITSIRLGVIGLQQELLKAQESPVGTFFSAGTSGLFSAFGNDTRKAAIADLQQQANSIAAGRTERMGRTVQAAPRLKGFVELPPEAENAIKDQPKQQQMTNDILSRMLRAMEEMNRQDNRFKVARA